MARVGEILEYKRTETDSGVAISDVQVDLGGGNIVTARHYQAPGDDSYPLVGEYALCVETGSEYTVVGFIDPQLTYEAEEGERLLFSRSALGQIKAKLHLKADGSVVINETVTIDPDGNITTDGTIDAAGAISSDGEVTAMAAGPGITLSQHLHPTGVGPTSPPTEGT